MTDGIETRTIDSAAIEQPFRPDENWLAVEAAGDQWHALWDPSYGDGVTPEFMRYFGLEFDTADVADLEGREMPVRTDETGKWVAVDFETIRDESGESNE